LALTTTGTLSSPIAVFYEKQFLLRSEKNFVLEPLGMAGRIPKGQGKTVVWNRMTNPTAKTTALTEGTDPTPTGLSASLVSASLSQYGNYEQVTDVLELTAVDTTVKEVIETLAYEAALSIDTTIRDDIVTGGTAQYASGVAARNSLVATDVVQVADIRKAKRQLARFSARPPKGNKFVAAAHPDVIYDLEGDSNWVNAHIYTEKGIEGIYNGEAGEVYGTKWVNYENASVLTNSGSAGTEVYPTFIMGRQFFGISKLQNLETYVDSPSPRSALRLYSDIGWKAGYVVSALNDSFAIRLESGATA